MNEPDIKQSPETQKLDETQELDETQVDEVGGGGDNCTPEQYLAATGSLTQAYDNLVDFTSHVIGRVAGENNN